MITRTEVKELSQFVVAIIQADRLGVGLSKLLKVQSKQMRMAAKQRAQEKAFKAPVKMLFPMILFIFPSIFVILLVLLFYIYHKFLLTCNISYKI